MAAVAHMFTQRQHIVITIAHEDSCTKDAMFEEFPLDKASHLGALNFVYSSKVCFKALI